MASLNNMVKLIHNMVGTKDLNDWETDFIESCWEFSKEGTSTSYLSGKQVEIIERIYNKHFA